MRIHIDVAAHSSMLEPILAEFGTFCRTIRVRRAPASRYVSNLTGTWITAADVTDPDYWVRHLRESVRFSDGIETILADPEPRAARDRPRPHARQPRPAGARRPAVGIAPTLRHPQEESSDVAFVLGALGRVWVSGVELDAADAVRRPGSAARAAADVSVRAAALLGRCRMPSSTPSRSHGPAAQAPRHRRVVLHVVVAAIVRQPERVDALTGSTADGHHRRRTARGRPAR